MTHKFDPVARSCKDVPGTLPPTGVFVRPVGARQGPLCTADLVHTASWGAGGQAQREKQFTHGQRSRRVSSPRSYLSHGGCQVSGTGHPESSVPGSGIC